MNRPFKRIVNSQSQRESLLKKTIKASKIQEENNAIERMKHHIEFVKDMQLDFYVEFLQIMVLYLEFNFHRRNKTQLPIRINNSISWIAENKIKIENKYLALIDEGYSEFENETEFPEIQLIALEYGFQLLLFNSKIEFSEFLESLHKQALSYDNN